MPNRPGFYKKGAWYVTSSGRKQHEKLCKIEEGRKAAEIALAKLLVDNHEKPVLSGGLTVMEAYERFMDYKKANSAPRTYETYLDRMRSFLEDFHHKKLSSITPEDGVRFKNFLLTKPWGRGRKKHSGVSNQTINGIFAAIKAFFNWCAKPSRQKVTGIYSNPWVEIEPSKVHKKSRILTDEEFNHLLDNCTNGNKVGGGRDFKEQLIVLRWTTFRPGELRHLRWEYVNFERHQIAFPAEVIKTRTRRIVTMLDIVEEVLQIRRERAKKNGFKLDGFVFPKPQKLHGSNYAAENGPEMQNPSEFAQRFRRLVKKCEKKKLIKRTIAGETLVPYTFRHSSITRLASQGHNHAVIMSEAGHTNPRTTMHYVHLADEQVTKAIREKGESDGTAN